MRNLFLLMVLFRVTPPASLYPTGADPTACATMEPIHDGNRATGNPQFTFTVSELSGFAASSYRLGEIVTSKNSFTLQR